MRVRSIPDPRLRAIGRLRATGRCRFTVGRIGNPSHQSLGPGMFPSAGRLGERFIAPAPSVYQQNDRRAAIKRQFNERLGSEIIEEKSYRPAGATEPARRSAAGPEPHRIPRQSIRPINRSKSIFKTKSTVDDQERPRTRQISERAPRGRRRNPRSVSAFTRSSFRGARGAVA